LNDPTERCFSIEYAYDGSAYSGWQFQPDRRTVQGEIMSALERVLRHPIKLTGAGRTDAGVHALATLSSFNSCTAYGSNVLFKALSRMLPRDIRMLRVDERPLGFSARFTAIRREYEYRVLMGRDPFRRQHCWEIGHALNLEAMREALSPLKGSLDCTPFCVSRSLKEMSLCDFHSSSIQQVGDEVRFVVSCNRFLHSMVRTLMGTLYDIGRGRFEPSRMLDILSTQDRDLCGLTAPPHGLYFRRVFYPDFATGAKEGLKLGSKSFETTTTQEGREA
jgi:tRNA pseudouridine38-40 synthase